MKKDALVFVDDLLRASSSLPAHLLCETAMSDYHVGRTIRASEAGEDGPFALVSAELQSCSYSAFFMREISQLPEVGRSADDLLLFIARLAKCGVRFISIDDEIDSDIPVGILASRIETALGVARKKIRTQKIQRSLFRAQERGVSIGRPKLTDGTKISELRREGKSLTEIAKALHISRGAVQYALKRASP